MPALLLQPPVCDPHAPLLALPALAAALEQAGRPVRCLDLNLELYEALATEEGLDLLRRDALHEWRHLQRGAPAPLARAALGRSRLDLPDLAERIADGHRALRDPDLYRLGDDGRLRLTDRLAGWHSAGALLGFPPAPFTAARAKAVLDGLEPLPFRAWLEEAAVPQILALDPTWVGVSVTFEQQLLPALTLAGLLRRRGLPVFAGGFHLSTVGAAGLLADPDLFDLVDGVVVGEGERAIVALDHALEAGRDPGTVTGVVVAASTPDAPPAPLPDMAELATPQLSALPLDRYLAPAVVLPIQASRGCWFGRCSFCNFAAVSPGYRRRPVELVLDDLVALAPLGGAIAFAMEAEPPNVCRQLSQGLIDRGVDLPWEIMARLDRGLDERTLRSMAEAGCRTIFFGVEAASARVNALMRKEVSGDAARKVLAGCADAGINVVLSAITGFPGESAREADLTRALLAWAQREFGDRIVVNGGLHRFRLARGAPVWQDPAAFGLRPAALDEVGHLAVSVPYEVVEPPRPEAAGRERDPLLGPHQLDSPGGRPPPPPPTRRSRRPAGHDLLRLLLETGHPDGFRRQLLVDRPPPPPPPRPDRFIVDPGASFRPDPSGPVLLCINPEFSPSPVPVPLWIEPLLEACRQPGGAGIDDLVALVDRVRPPDGPPGTAWLGRLLPRLWSAGILDGA